MREFIRPGNALMMLVIGVTGAAIAWAGWSKVVNRPGQPGRSAILLAAAPEASGIITERIHGKRRVVDRLLAGELTLLEAAAWFRFLNDNPPHLSSHFRKAFPGRSDGEKACRQVISWAQTRLQTELPESQTALVICRLQSELDGLLAEKEHVELPW